MPVRGGLACLCDVRTVSENFGKRAEKRMVMICFFLWNLPDMGNLRG